MSTAMDIHLNITDSPTLQDMFDVDIKSEMDTLVGGHNDLSGFNFNFNDLPPLELEEEIRLISSNSVFNFGDFNEDLSCVPMVNPNVAMPIHNGGSPSPQLKSSHLTFSPCSIKISGFNKSTAAAEFKKDLLEQLNSVGDRKKQAERPPKPLVVVKPVVVKTKPAILTFKDKSCNRNKNHPPNVTVSYPKPPYSYSCLIVLALKNSCSGCLPVSEIYSFMCRHFPYFKTAPSGWKNSVRHNLSLNKCFQKIVKPAINGTQRKGCLWAMNPNKIAKMDDELQKWSRKDAGAIMKAMVHPEHLDSLERGELKFTYEEDAVGDSCGSAAESSGEESESEPEQERGYDLPEYTFVTKTKLPEENSLYDDQIGIEDDKEVLRVEMALAQKELMQYETANGNKKRRLFIIQK